MRRTPLWVLAAVTGVLVVAGVTYAASSLTTQTVGLSSEPLSAGEQLVPTATATPPHADGDAHPQAQKEEDEAEADPDRHADGRPHGRAHVRRPRWRRTTIRAGAAVVAAAATTTAATTTRATGRGDDD